MSGTIVLHCWELWALMILGYFVYGSGGLVVNDYSSVSGKLFIYKWTAKPWLGPPVLVLLQFLFIWIDQVHWCFCPVLLTMV